MRRQSLRGIHRILTPESMQNGRVQAGDRPGRGAEVRGHPPRERHPKRSASLKTHNAAMLRGSGRTYRQQLGFSTLKAGVSELPVGRVASNLRREMHVTAVLAR